MPMRPRRHHPLKWPTVIALALTCLFVGVFWVPQQWIDLFFSPLDTKILGSKNQSTPWMIIMPPLVVEALPATNEPAQKKDSSEPKTPPAHDPGWWTAAWQVKTTVDSAPLLAPASRDSVALLLKTLGVGMDFTRKALPDSVLDHRLMLLRIEDSFAFEELKPYLAALGMARARADKNSREADMYDEHLGSQIMTPD